MRTGSLIFLLSTFLIATAALAAGPQGTGARLDTRPIPTSDTFQATLTSSSSRLMLMRESAGPDTFALYGGPDRGAEGKFESGAGVPDAQGWFGVDLTDQPQHWQVSTFNAANLGDHGEGNHAFWAGYTQEQMPGWATPPGYGNSWNTSVLYESGPVSDPSAGQTVYLDFYSNCELEPGYDFFHVEYDSAGTWVSCLATGGYGQGPGGVFPAPGTRFVDLATKSIQFAGNDYGGVDGDRIRIRLRMTSDGAWSDQDGLWPTDGAVQLDDIVITTSEETVYEDFEGPGPYLFVPVRSPMVGNFASLFVNLTDLDPCVDNRSGLMGFIDYGQQIPNGPGHDGRTSTGGSLSNNWDYGLPGGWVVNYTDGLASTLTEPVQPYLQNEIWSPEIDWDLPGTADDGADAVGAKMRFSTYMHNPLMNGIFRVWAVRSRAAGGVWSQWKDRSFVYYSQAGPQWENVTLDVTNLLVGAPEKVQIAHGVADLASFFAFPGTDATPAPLFDNIALYKYRMGGPSLSTRIVDIANDGFPNGGSIDASTLAARDALDIRFDMARDINLNRPAIIPGDSIVVDAIAVLPGTTVTDVRLKWALRTNPFFDDVRSAPARPVDVNVDTSGPVWTGEVVAGQSTHSSGAPVANRYFADLPDEDFLHPGDRLHYYFEATDSGGRVTTLPGETSGFGEWDAYGASLFDRLWTLRCLPSIVDASGSQPPKFVYIDSTKHVGDLLAQEHEILLSLRQLGMREGVDFDLYVVRGASSGVSNGIGSAGAHGATAAQLAGYDTMVILTGALSTNLFSDGTGYSWGQKGDDVATLTGWKQLPGPRHSVYFGDHVVAGQTGDTALTYVQNIMGVQLRDANVRDEIAGQAAPIVWSNLPGLATQFVVWGGCPSLQTFDSIDPRPGAVAGHSWVSPAGMVYPDPVASVVFDRMVDGQRKVDITYPYSFGNVRGDVLGRSVAGVSTRTLLLEETFAYMGVASEGGVVTAAPRPRTIELQVAPNPFNPRTEVVFQAPAGSRATVVVYDLRGREVTRLLDEPTDGNTHRLVWDAAEQASGIYLVRIEADGLSRSQKVALVR